MELIKVRVNGACAQTVCCKAITSGMVGVEVTFEYVDPVWDSLRKTAVFWAGDVIKDVVAIGSTVKIPPEVLAASGRRLKIGVYGVSKDGTLAIPTIWADVGIICRGANPSGDESTDPTPAVWQQILNLMGDLADLNTMNKTTLVAAINEAMAKSSGEADPEEIQRIVNEYLEENSPADGVDGVPGHWQEALDSRVEAINTALCNAGQNKSAFLFYSDVHWNYGSQMSPTLLKYLYNHTGMNKTFFGGDIVNDEATDYDTMEYLWEWRRQLKGLPNHHSVPGNHDDGNSTNNLFSEQYVYGYLLAAEETPDIVRGDSGLYYYIDNPAEKTRYLCLDTGYKDISSLSTNQAAFIKDSLKSTQEGWHIVVVAHIWYGLDYDQYDKRPVPIEGMSATASSITAILDNYNSRIGEFADCGAWVEFCIGGHIHYDYDAVTATGIPIILVETDSHHTRGSYTASPGTTTEASVNGIIADYDAHEIHVIRIGRGVSRTVEITNYVLNYTNVLPTALAADGVSIYNADDTPGYKANTRWSASSNSEIAAEGIHLTGWIPISAGDVIRLKHITLPNESSNACMIHVFTDNFTTASGNINNADLNSHYSPVWDDSGNLTQFTVPSNASCTHLRIQCGGITDASIITIDEPIE